MNAAIESLLPAVDAIESGRVVTARLRSTSASRAGIRYGERYVFALAVVSDPPI